MHWLIENFAGKKVDPIKQEFYGTILTYNLAIIALKQPVEKRNNSIKKKYQYKTNKRSLLTKFKQCFIKIFFDPENLTKTFEEIIKPVAKESVPVRPNRHFERLKTQKVKKKHHKAYIPVA